jgi:hypothetical protein
MNYASKPNRVAVTLAVCFLVSLASPRAQQPPSDPAPIPPPAIPAAAAAIEQTAHGRRPALPVLESFDGLGSGFTGPQGTAAFRNPSDNSLAVGPDHIVQTVNSRLAVFTKKGQRYDTTGAVLYGPVLTNTLFAGFGGVCEARNNGDAVVRYDQLAQRWLLVMPIFRRIAPGDFPPSPDPATGQPATHGQLARPGQASAPGDPAAPPANPPPPPPAPPRAGQTRPGPPPKAPQPPPPGVFAMCYAVSTTTDPLGPWHRYAFERTLFPDYPRPAVWPDGYYNPTSTGDDVIQKHICIADRARMLAGQPATEQCLVIDGVNFLNNADIDGFQLPPPGAPNIMMATGGAQLHNILTDDGIYWWKIHVDWQKPAATRLDGPHKIPVAPYHYLCGGQLTSCVPQPGTERRLDVQGDKLMQRLIYRRIGRRESIVAAHSIATASGSGGVRWYEFRLDKKRTPRLYQQGTYAPDAAYRFMPSIAMDKQGNIGVGYSFGSADHFPGQRFAARRDRDPRGSLTFRESVLATGEAAQTTTLRWQDYTTTALDPSDDCTFWYVGDYLRKSDSHYRTRIAALRLPNCH